MTARVSAREESPGTAGQGCWITSRRGNATEESAAENIPP